MESNTNSIGQSSKAAAAGTKAGIKGAKAAGKLAISHPYIFIGLVIALLLIFLCVLVSGTSGAELSNTYVKSPSGTPEQYQWKPSKEEQHDALWEKSVATETASELLSIVNDFKDSERSSLENKVHNDIISKYGDKIDWGRTLQEISYDEATSQAIAKDVDSSSSSDSEDSADANKISKVAKSLASNKYNYKSGGVTLTHKRGKGTDCGGFVMRVLERCGYHPGTGNLKKLYNKYKSHEVKSAEGKYKKSTLMKILQPGDIIFFQCRDGTRNGGNGLIYHVAIYIGNGKAAMASPGGTRNRNLFSGNVLYGKHGGYKVYALIRLSNSDSKAKAKTASTDTSSSSQNSASIKTTSSKSSTSDSTYTTESKVIERIKSNGVTIEGKGKLSATQATNAVLTFQALKKDGCSDAAAAAVLGNLCQESTFNTDGAGICQWTDSSRFSRLKAFAKEKNLSVTNINAQIQYMIKEANERSFYKSFKKMSNIDEAAVIWRDKFEQAGDSAEAVEKRKSYARQWYKILKGNVTAADTSNSTSMGTVKILSAFSVKLDNAELEWKKKDSSGVLPMESWSLYTKSGDEVKLVHNILFNREENGQIDYAAMLKKYCKKFKAKGGSFYTVDYEKDSSGNIKVYSEETEADGNDGTSSSKTIYYVKPIVKEKELDDISEDLFDIDPDAEYANTKDQKLKASKITYSDVIESLAETTAALIYDVEAMSSDGGEDLGGQMLFPLKGGPSKYTQTSKFWEARSYENHPGEDWAAAEGTEIYAAADGEVITAGTYGGYGNAVIIKHSSSLISIYGHMVNGGITVKVGQKVTKGQLIGHVGSTGWSTGNHLHFEIRRNGNAVNPSNYYRK